MKHRRPMNSRVKKIWDFVREQKVGDLVDQFQQYSENVANGADPIEALSGHLCGPHCWHWDNIDENRRARLRKAPWNRRGYKGRR